MFWKRPKKSAKSKLRTLSIEHLDKREMLDASGLLSFGSIDGIVAIDLNGNGSVESSETIAGADVKIVLDDGDGVYSASDTVVTTATTDANGYYVARGLATGNYFVVQCDQTADGYDLAESVSPLKAISGDAQTGTSIDTFDDNYGPVVDAVPSGTPEEQTFSSPTAIGGEIDLLSHAVAGSGSDEVTVETDTGFLEFSSDFNATGTWQVTWDGADAGGAGVNGTGLGGVDLTDIGGNSGSAYSFMLENLQVDATGVNNTDVTVRIYSSATDFSEATFTITTNQATDYCLDFDDFVTVSGSGADFTNVGAVQLEIAASVNGVDGQLDFSGGIGSVPEYCLFLNPQPVASIDIEKFTNGAQADDPGGADVPTLIAGSTVTWTYVVTNDGEVPITNVTVTDSPQGLVSNITNQGDGDSTLDVGESWTYTLTGTAVTGDYGNAGTAIGDAGGAGVMDTDNSNYVGIAAAPGVNIEKLTNGAQADNADDGDVPTITEGDSVTFTYIVTNTGNVPLSHVAVTDSDSGAVSNLISGDTNGDGLLDTDETWEYEVSSTAALGDQSCTGSVTTDEGVSDSDDSHYVGVVAAAPDVNIEKLTNGAQADNAGDADVPTLNEGDSVTFTYIVTNTGNVPLSNVTVTDSVSGAVSNLISGDTNGDGLLDLTETWEYEVTSTAAAGDQSCTGTVTTDEGVSDSDDSHYVGVATPAPDVNIEKLTNGAQADNAGDADVPAITEGGSVTFTYVVTNTGNVPLSNVTVTDSDSGTVSNLISGDTNGDGLLDLTETWEYEVTSTAALGDQSCTGTVTTDEGVSDSDDSHYVGVSGAAPDVNIEKLTNGAQADNAGDADVPTITEGDSVTFTYIVTNTGNVPLSNVTVTDSVSGTVSNLISGDTNGDGLLDTDETWEYEVTGTAALGDQDCTGTVTTDEGVSDSDDSHYVGVSGDVPGVAIEKLTNGAQADNAGDADVPSLTEGDSVTFTYIVTNTGNVPLSNVTVTDSVSGTVSNLVSGDTNGDGLLDTDETWEYEVTSTAALGDQDCTGTVTTDEGVSDSDDSHYVGVSGPTPGVDIEKFTNGAQADNAGDADVPTLTVGDTVLFTYIVTNTGNVPLTNVTVTDSVGGAVANLVSGDVNGDGILDLTETWIFEATATAALGANDCTGTVTTDEGVSDADDSHYVGDPAPAPSVDIEKLTNNQQADNPGDADVPSVTEGETVTFTYIVTNTGNVPLTNVTVTDSVSGAVTNLVSGDDNGDGILDLTETWTFEVTAPAALGANSCTGTVTTDEGVTDSDDSNYVGDPSVAVDIEKFTNGQQADSLADPDVPTVAVGSDVTLTYVVTNPGNVPLNSVVVTDSVHGVITNLVSGDDNGDGILDVNETWEFEFVTTAVLGDSSCTATVTTAEGVTDSDDSNHRGTDAEISVVKQVVGTPVALASNTDHFEVTFEATIENTGPVTLDGLDLYDDMAAQFNGAFVSVASPAVITGHTLASAASLPTINSAWATDVTQSIFNDDGSISPGETITLQFVVVVDAVAAANSPIENQIQVVADDPLTGFENGPLDDSDDGTDNGGNNGDFPGDTGGSDDPSPVFLPFGSIGSIQGNVFVDANNNATFDGGESPIGGVTIQLSGLDVNGTTISQTAVTDGTGAFGFFDLFEGNYTLFEQHPQAFLDGQEELGDFGGQVPADDTFEIALFFGNGVDPADLNGQAYNFGELGADPRIEGKTPFLITTVASAAGGSTPAAAGRVISTAQNQRPVFDGETLVISGTAGVDEVVITAGDNVHTVEVNGVVREYAAERYRNIRFDGGAGDDHVTLVGSDADDRAVLHPFRGRIVSDAYEIHASNVRYIEAQGGGGTDDAFLVDGAGNDVFLGAASYASMRDVQNEYKNELRGFEKLTGNAVMGGNDTAVIYDSWRDDAFLSVAGYSQMIGGEYEVRANKFEFIEARADAGGVDSIELRDSVGSDVFETDGNRSTLHYETGYRTMATGFEFSDVLSRDGHDTATVVNFDVQSALDANYTEEKRGMRLRAFDMVNAESDDGEETVSELQNIDFVFERMDEWS